MNFAKKIVSRPHGSEAALFTMFNEPFANMTFLIGLAFHSLASDPSTEKMAFTIMLERRGHIVGGFIPTSFQLLLSSTCSNQDLLQAFDPWIANGAHEQAAAVLRLYRNLKQFSDRVSLSLIYGAVHVDAAML